MSRFLRIQYPGAWYHVMHRGASHQTIFHTPTHFEIFLNLLEKASEKFKIEIHAYCLMNNHYHLLIHTPYGNLSEAMRHINGLFAQKYNRLHHKDGSLFRGRYKAILLDADNYLLQLSRYIHLNPVAAGISKTPEAYSWSSYKFYVQLAQKPSWLFCDKTLKFFGEKNKVELYKKFVFEGMETPDKCSIDKNKYLNFPILGEQKFIDNVKKEHDLMLFHEEVPDYFKIHKRSAVSAESIIDTIAIHYHVCPKDIASSPKNKKRGNLPRKLAIYLSVKKTLQTHRVIANLFGGISCGAVSKICMEIEMELKKNEELSRVIHGLIETINSRCVEF